MVSFLAETFKWNMHSLGSTQMVFRGYLTILASLVAQLVKNPPAMWETWVQSLGWEDTLEKGKAPHSSILAWKSPWAVHGVSKSQTQLRDLTFSLSTIQK